MTTDPGRPILPDNIGFHIRMAQMRVFREFYRTFEGSGVTPGMHTVLVIIRDNPGIRQGALAEPLMVNPTNITLLIAKLHGAGLISRKIENSDRRAVHLYLTGRGKQLLEAMQDRLDALEQKLLGNLDDRQRIALRQFLGSILDRTTESGSAARRPAAAPAGS